MSTSKTPVQFDTELALLYGNLALINLAKAHLGVTQFEELAMLDHIRDEVAEAYARTHARYQQILEEEEAVQSSIRGFREDLERIKQAAGLPIEVLNNLRLKADSAYEYLEAIVGYNRAHFELYVALGQPPAACLARPVPAEGIPDSIAPTVSGATRVRSTAAPPPLPAANAGPVQPDATPTAPAAGPSAFAPPSP